MKYSCYCGDQVEISYKEVRRLLSGTTIFCSGDCLHKFILDNEYKEKEFRPEANLFPPNDVWDKVTKRFYRSFYEVYLARFFVDKGFNWFYEAVTFNLGGKTYTPDFYLPDYDLHFECKGRWLGSGQMKFKMAQEVILLPSYFQKIIGKEYGKKNEVVGG